MNAGEESKKLSKFISYVLRHHPETIGLTLDRNGWADAGELIEKMNGNGYLLSPEMLRHLVATNSKQRFSFDETGTKIRASQGHSINVDLGLKEMEPPALLYHGTGKQSVPSILAGGLERRGRRHVHLSADAATAHAVGQRHGKPEIFVIAAAEMHRGGHAFYLSENGVWLTDSVPARYLQLLRKGPG